MKFMMFVLPTGWTFEERRNLRPLAATTHAISRCWMNCAPGRTRRGAGSTCLRRLSIIFIRGL